MPATGCPSSVLLVFAIFFSRFFSIFSPLPKLPGHCSMADKRKIKGKQNENGWGGLGKMGEKKSLLISSLKNC